MGLLEEFAFPWVHWSLGLTILVGLTASEFSGASTIVALPVAASAATLSALCATSLNVPTTGTYKKRKFCDILEFFGIWLEILEILAAAATCARVASAAVDYISNERPREWFLGIESHSLGEPWPDVLGVSIVIVVTALCMLGLEKSSSFSALLFVAIFGTFLFFAVVGGLHVVVNLTKWSEDFKETSVKSVMAAATLCCYGFVNTLPRMASYRALKIFTMVFVPLMLYSTTILIFTLMSHYKELAGTATPLLRVFELRDVDWARLVMAVCIICIVCLALTEVLPTLYGLLMTLAGKEWQVFLASLQYRNSLTGAPMLAIFAAGSLAAILAFACPLAYLVKILSASTLLKCFLRSFHAIYYQYRPEFTNDSLLINNTNTQYSQLKQTTKSSKQPAVKGKSRFLGLVPCFSKNVSPSGFGKKRNMPKELGATQDNEYLLLNDYCDKSITLTVNEESSDESEIEKESVLSSDVEDSYSSTDIDAVVQEYKDKVQVATIDNFSKNRQPTYLTAATVVIFTIVIIFSSIFLSQVIELNLSNLTWPCLIVFFFSTTIILLMPKNSTTIEDELLPKSVVPLCAIISIKLNIILTASIIKDVWPGFVFWICAGGLLFWRCDCCTCDGLLPSKKHKPNITENISQYSGNYVDTVLIAR